MMDDRYREITLDMVMTHTSGLPNIGNRHFIHPPNDSMALTEFAQALSRKKLAYPPGVDLSADTYSNTGYDILGRVIERVSGITYARYVTDHVLKPAGLDSSSFFIQDIDPARTARPHGKNLFGAVHVSSYYPDIPQDKPCGNLNSNARDLARWCIHIMNIHKKTPPPHAVVSHETLENMWTPHRIIKGKKTAMGLGWWMNDSDRFGRFFFHVGNDPGFSATLNIYPSLDIGIVILTNAQYPMNIVWNKIPGEMMSILTSK
jgi:CubicO group peptidase (beta-lactamase class C family)